MSHRHLMSRFAAGAPRVEWRHGWEWMLPGRVAEIEHFNSEHTGPDADDDSEPVDRGDYSTGIAHHGEQRYALEVSPDTDRESWSWAIHKQVGPDAENPDHWEHMGGLSMDCFCGWGYKDGQPKWADQRFFGWTRPDEKTKGFDREVSGYANAQAAAEKAFQEHIASQRHSPADYDRMVGDLDEPEGGYDIFGDKP